MSFQIKLHENGKCGMVAICDVCGTLVAGEQANVLWQPTEKPGLYPFTIACKGRIGEFGEIVGVDCTKVVDAALGRQHWQGLDLALGYLLNNTSTDLSKVQHAMEMVAQLP